MLALLLVLAMSVNAFAAELDAQGESQDIDVKASYTTSATTPTVYSVDITWGAMEFTYSVGGTKDWNPADHSYSDNTTATWTASGNTVTVTNHSNDEVTASFAFAAKAGFETVTGSFDKASATLPSAEGKAVDATELAATATLTLAGTLAAETAANTTVGTITVTIQ